MGARLSTRSGSGDAAPTAIVAIARGLLAGAVGTAAMDALLFRRYRREGGTEDAVGWETSAGVTDWEQAPAPALVGKRLVEGVFAIQLPPARARLVNNVTHWAFGILNGAGYGVIVGSLRRPRIRYGPPFGAAVWSSGYVVLPLAKLYEPIWKYDARTLAEDLSAHLLYGTTTAAAYSLLSRGARGDR